MSKSLPYSIKDVDYDNAKFRHRSFSKVRFSLQFRSNRRRFPQYLSSLAASIPLILITLVRFSIILTLVSFCTPCHCEFVMGISVSLRRNKCLVICYVLIFQVVTQNLLTGNLKRDCVSCSTGKFLFLILIFGVAYLLLGHSSSGGVVSNDKTIVNRVSYANSSIVDGAGRIKRFWRRPPRLPPRLSPDEKVSSNGAGQVLENPDVVRSMWIARQQKVKEAFLHAWSGYKKFAMGRDELMPLSRQGVDGLGGLGATVVDALDTAMIMGLDDVVAEAGSWVEKHLSERIRTKGQVNLFETTIRVLGGLLSAYHLRGGENGMNITQAGPKPEVYLATAKDLADRLLSAFTTSPTAIPFSDVILHDKSAQPAPGGLSSTSEVSTVQLEFNYLSSVSGDQKYGLEAMKVMEHMKTLPKFEGLVPIYIRYETEYNLIIVFGINIQLELFLISLLIGFVHTLILFSFIFSSCFYWHLVISNN